MKKAPYWLRALGFDLAWFLPLPKRVKHWAFMKTFGEDPGDGNADHRV